MTTSLPASDVQLLDSLAELLMWAGKDRAADTIYAAIEADDLAPADSTIGNRLD